MKAFALKSIVVALGVATCGAALAANDGDWMAAIKGEDSGSFHLSQQPWVSARTRAEVIAEMKAARKDGTLELASSEAGGPIYALARPASTVTRAQVRDELRVALASGEFDAQHSEAGESLMPKRVVAPIKHYAGPSPGRDVVPALVATLVASGG